MLPIVILSFIAVYIFFERWFAIKKAARVDQNFMNRIKDYIMEGKVDSARALCQSTENPVARMKPISHNTASRSAEPVELAYCIRNEASGIPMMPPATRRIAATQANRGGRPARARANPNVAPAQSNAKYGNTGYGFGANTICT